MLNKNKSLFYYFFAKRFKIKKYLITTKSIQTTILDFQLSNKFEQYESHMNAKEQQTMLKIWEFKPFILVNL